MGFAHPHSPTPSIIILLRHHPNHTHTHCSSHPQTQFVINLNALPALLWMLDNAKKNIRKEACWTISNITAGTSEQVQCSAVQCSCCVRR